MKRRLKKYQKESEEILNEFMKKVTHNTQRLALKFVNDMAKVDYEYKDVLEDSDKK